MTNKNKMFLKRKIKNSPRGENLPNFYSRAGRVVNILKNPLALKILLELYPSKRFTAERLSGELSVKTPDIDNVFLELEKNNFITNNPTSGNKILTEEGQFFLEQTATIYPELKEFLAEQNRMTN